MQANIGWGCILLALANNEKKLYRYYNETFNDYPT